MQKLTTVIMVTVILSGCASGPTPLQNRIDSIPEMQRGYAIGTYSVDCRVHRDSCIQAFNSITAYYRMTTDHEIRGNLDWTFGSLFRTNPTHDYINSEEGHKGFHFCVALPPGSYEFHSISYYNFAGGGSGYSVREKDFFSVPFLINPGEVSDLGSIRVTTTTGKNIFGMTLPAPGVMQISSARASDSKAAIMKCPESAKTMDVLSSPLQPAPGIPSPFVRVIDR